MGGVEFLSSGDEPWQDEPETDEPSMPPVTGRRRWLQPAALTVVAAAAVTTLALTNTGGGSPAHPVPTPTPSPTAPVHVHIDRYAPWHERAIQGGGGAYIF